MLPDGPKTADLKPFRRHGDIDRLLSDFAGQRILVVGDVMLDRYIWGEADRISPEAPVQVVRVERETSTLGGAGNVAHNLAALGARTFVAGIIGDDWTGDRIAHLFERLGVGIEGLLRDPNRASTQKTRVCAAGQQVLRIDREETVPIDEPLVDALYGYVRDNLSQFDGILVSDYSKGTLPPSLLERLIDLARKGGKPVVVDPKGDNYARYRNGSMITPNLKETAAATGLPVDTAEHLEQAARVLQQRVGNCMILITRGKDGMTLFRTGAQPYHIPARSREVFDVSGAGDTVLAVAGLGLSSGLTPEIAAWVANLAAGVVVGKVGTSPISTQELREALWQETFPGLRKFRDMDALLRAAAALREQGKTIVFTNGCFDLLHAGHIRLLEASKACGDVLIVAIDSDSSVRKIKGEGRPILKEDDRIRIISALDSVDLVTIFPPDGLLPLLDGLRPHILTKGSNYAEDEVLGREIVERHGGEVRLIPIRDELSVSGLIRRILDNSDGSKNNA